MTLIVVAIGAVVLMFSGRLGVDTGENAQNWGLIVATLVGGWLAFGPPYGKEG